MDQPDPTLTRPLRTRHGVLVGSSWEGTQQVVPLVVDGPERTAQPWCRSVASGAAAGSLRVRVELDGVAIHVDGAAAPEGALLLGLLVPAVRRTPRT